MYALLDCNSFYASCERIFRPDLRRRPVAVLSNNDGCVIAMTREVKRMGIKMGAPYFKCRRMFEKEGVEVFSSNFELYGDISARVMDCLRSQFGDDVSVYSIDEAFIRLPFEPEAAWGPLMEARRTVERWTGVPVCVGGGATRTLAKVANKLAKSALPVGGGVHVIDSEAGRLEALAQTGLGDVWGVGRRTKPRLEAEGMRTALDLANARSSPTVEKAGVCMGRVVRELNGEHSPGPLWPKRKTLAHTRMIPGKARDEAALVRIARLFTELAAEKMRKEGMYAGAINVFAGVCTIDGERSSSEGRTAILPSPTADTLELMAAAEGLVRRIHRRHRQYFRLGVVLLELTDSRTGELDMFGAKGGRDALLGAVDDLNGRFGRGTVTFGDYRWVPRQARMSPRYTTRFDEVCVVR